MRPPNDSKTRVLVVEDDPDISDVLQHALAENSYDVRAVETGAQALGQIGPFAPDLVLLDLVLPDISGIEICRRIRADAQAKQPAIIILTARGEEVDRVVGFAVGADDYVVKPFSVRELMLRVRARLPQVARNEESGAAMRTTTTTPLRSRRGFVVGPLEIDLDSHRLSANGQNIPVTSLEMRFLAFLARAEGRVCTRKALLTHVWDYDADVPSRTVDTHVKRLRQKLGPAGLLIQTVRSLGYRLSDPYQSPKRQS